MAKLKTANGFRSTELVALGEDIVATGFLPAAYNAEQFVNTNLWLVGENDELAAPAVMQLEVYVSDQEEQPDWTAAVSATNLYSRVALNDLVTGALTSGATAIAFAANGSKLLMPNINGFRWLNVKVSAYTSGKLSVFAKPYNQS